MKKTIFTLSLLALAFAGLAHAADFDVDPAHTSVGFNIKHLVGRVNGSFTDFTGTFSFEQGKPAKDKVEFTVKTASINTQNEKRDTHLKSPDFFDVAKYPTMTFVSKKVVAAGKDKLKVTGDLTLHGVTHEETFNVEFGGIAKDPWGNTRAGFSATTTLNRKTYGIIWNKTLDSGSLMLGEDVNVVLQVEATQKADATATKKQ
jgi:polyisoprenoid-binding protein YceI